MRVDEKAENVEECKYGRKVVVVVVVVVREGVVGGMKEEGCTIPTGLRVKKRNKTQEWKIIKDKSAWKRRKEANWEKGGRKDKDEVETTK